jgi:hypothetical protein
MKFIYENLFMKNQANMKWNEGVDAVPIFIDSLF